jgi:hypothetical protein
VAPVISGAAVHLFMCWKLLSRAKKMAMAMHAVDETSHYRCRKKTQQLGYTKEPWHCCD